MEGTGRAGNWDLFVIEKKGGGGGTLFFESSLVWVYGGLMGRGI